MVKIGAREKDEWQQEMKEQKQVLSITICLRKFRKDSWYGCPTDLDRNDED